MLTAYSAAAKLPITEMTKLHAYRHAVFVERLGWDLPMARNGLEIDQFDRDDTIHVLASGVDGALCGCARLLPTSLPYLLGDVFPELMHGKPLPNSIDVWEISRFCSVNISSDTGSSRSQQSDEWGCRNILKAIVTCALEVGAKKLIAVSPISMERITKRLGVHAYRAGSPMRIRGHTIFAFWIELDEITKHALGI